MDTIKRTKRQSLDALLEKAADLHGHFGPFLALGVRMGLIGLRELETKEGDRQLSAIVTLDYKVPYSCLIDGIQVATKCTVGNKRLKWKESKEFTAAFTLKDKGRSVRVIVNPSLIQELTTKLTKRLSDADICQLGSEVASRLEKDLFLVSGK
jgi:formylmethanofuran dehydrogenase subunit E